MEYVASLSCGKDSLAMVLRLIEEKEPLTRCVFYDTGAEFEAIYNNLEKVKKLVRVDVIKPKTNFYLDMLARPIKGGHHYGYEWCGGCTRWRTAGKVSAINNYLKSLQDEYIQYIGIACDEPKRIKDENNKRYPLVEWGMTEKDCLEYCRNHGYGWNEDGVDLYDILDRVSCWCCGNKNLKELYNMYKYLPRHWQYLKGLQSRMLRPFRRDGKTVFDLDNIFYNKLQQEEKDENFDGDRQGVGLDDKRDGTGGILSRTRQDC